jgi:predicted deacylase
MPNGFKTQDRIDLEALSLRTHHRIVLHANGPAPQPAIDIPVHVLVGRKRRPCMAVVGGVHGDEYDGIRAAQRLVSEESCSALEGTLVVIPVANPFAFAAGRRETPFDGVDLNRVFPGNAAGTLTERLAHILCSSVLQDMDFIFTMHGASAVTTLAWYLEFFDSDSPAGRASRAAATAAGFANLIAFPETKGFLLPSLGKLGVPVIEGEVGGRGELNEDNAAYYVDRVHAVMKHLGLIETGPAVEPFKTWRTVDVMAPVGGIMSRELALSQKVESGQRLGAILSLDGSERTEILAPVSGILGGFRAHARIEQGQLAFRVFAPVDQPRG